MKTYQVFIVPGLVVFQSKTFPFFYHSPEISEKISSTVVDEWENIVIEYINIQPVIEKVPAANHSPIVDFIWIDKKTIEDSSVENYKKQINPSDLSYMFSIYQMKQLNNALVDGC